MDETKPVWGGRVGTSFLQFLIILAAGWLTWWIFADPKGLLALYPQPSMCVLFWAIIMVVWLCVNFGGWPFPGMKQPLRGIVYTVLSVGVGSLLVWLFVSGWGGWNPTFHFARPDGLGYAATGLIILIGFFTWPTLVINWGDWPWTDAGLKQPLVGVAQFCLGSVLTLILYCVIVLPTLGFWPSPDWMTLRAPFFSLYEIVGWFYCVLAVCFLTANLWENWPWTIVKKRWAISLFSFFGMFALATLFYYFLRWWVTLVIPTNIQEIYGATTMPYQVACFFVCWVFWIVFWPNSAMGNWPTQFSKPVNIIVRSVITFALAIPVFLIGTRWAAVAILHEPAVLGTYGGDPMNWQNWLIFMLLLYFACWQSYGTIVKKS